MSHRHPVQTVTATTRAPRTRVSRETINDTHNIDPDFSRTKMFKNNSVMQAAIWLDDIRSTLGAEVAAILGVMLYVLPGQDDMLKLSIREEGGKWTHTLISMGAHNASTTKVLSKLLIEANRVTSLDNRMTKLGAQISKLEAGQKKTDVLTKQAELKALYKSSKVACKSLRESLGLDSSRYSDAEPEYNGVEGVAV